MEIEVKLQAPDEGAFERIPGLLAGLPVVVTEGDRAVVLDHYLDSPSWRVFRGGYACRVRWKGGRHFLTLKSLARPVDGLARREEYEGELRGFQGDPRQIPGDALGGRLAQLLGGEPLCLLFHVSQERRVWQLSGADALAIELSADTVVYQRGPRTLRFHEIELELRDGTEPQLLELTDLLQAAAGWSRAGGSKFERGLLFAGLVPGETPLSS